MSDRKTAEELAAWYAHGQALIAVLPPVDEDIERQADEALAKYHAKQKKAKIIRKRTP